MTLKQFLVQAPLGLVVKDNESCHYYYKDNNYYFGYSIIDPIAVMHGVFSIFPNLNNEVTQEMFDKMAPNSEFNIHNNLDCYQLTILKHATHIRRRKN